MAKFVNKKGGSLGFGKIISEITGARATSKKHKKTSGEISYIFKSLFGFIAFLLAGLKEMLLKGSDFENAVVVVSDVETGGEYSNAVINHKATKFAKQTVKGKHNLGSKTRIATSRLIENVTDNDAIDRRINRLKDDGYKDEVADIKSMMKAAKKNVPGYSRKSLNRMFINTTKLSNEDFLAQSEDLINDYLESLNVDDASTDTEA